MGSDLSTEVQHKLKEENNCLNQEFVQVWNLSINRHVLYKLCVKWN